MKYFFCPLLLVVFSTTLLGQQVKFKDVTLGSGITTPSPASSSFTNSWADFDNDDYWDLFIARGNYGSDQVPQVYHNLRNGTFSEITNTAFNSLPAGYYAHMCFGDFDNDGFVDCYQDAFVSSVNKLWKNNGNLTFTDVSTKMQNPGGQTTGTIWFDYDEDGFVDLLVNGQVGQGTTFYHNNGGKSLDVVNLFNNPAVGDIALATDINQDGWPDLYLHNDFVSDVFGLDILGSYTPFNNSFVANKFGSADVRGTAAFADIDNDGYPDFMYASPGKLVIWHNDSGKSFHDWTSELNLDKAQGGDHRMSFIQDVDNDGYLDLILYNNLDSSEIWYGGHQGFQRSTAPFSMNTNQIPSSLSWTDYDNDGFIDFLDVSKGTTELWHNEGNVNRWLNVKLRGHKANSMGLGSTVNVYAEGKKQDREIGFYQSYYGYEPAMAHFGFGAGGCAGSGVIDSVVVIWQPGGRQVIKNVRYNELAVIDQDSGIVRTIQRPLSTSFGYAYPYFLAAKKVYADTLVSMPMAVRLPKNFIAASLLVDEITFSIGYNSDVIDISSTKVKVRYIPPPGWTFKSSAMAKDSLSITITRAGGILLSDSMDLGSLTFDTYKANVRGTYIYLSAIIAHAKGKDYAFCHNYEGDFLGEVVVVERESSVVDGRGEGRGWDLSILPNPVVGNFVNVRFPMGLPGHILPIQISVFDVLGKEVYHFNGEGITEKNAIENFSIPTSQLSGGTYLVRVSSGGKVMIGKFTVVK